MIEKKINKMRGTKLAILFFLCILCAASIKENVLAATTCSSTTSYPGMTSTYVNIREEAGTEHRSYGVVRKNASLTILGSVTHKGVVWYKCSAPVNGTTRTGYMCANYIVKNSQEMGVVNDKVTSFLNVRQGPGTSYRSVLRIRRNTKMIVHGIRNASGRNWYKVSVKDGKRTVEGYVSAEYVNVYAQSEPQPEPSVPNDSSQSTNTSQEGYVNEKVFTFLNVRENPSTTSRVLLRIRRNTRMIVYGSEGNWYRVAVTANNKTVNAYVSKDYVTLIPKKEEEKKPEPPKLTPEQLEKQFEASLSVFPENYKAGIREMHKKYPNWKFVGINTGLDWNTVIANESVVGRNVIQSNYPRGYSSLAPFSYLSTQAGAYDWSKDTYKVRDGSNWYAAKPEVIAHYMDPRNFLNERDIFQFEALAYDSTQKSSVVQAILKDTFMHGNYSVTDITTHATVSGSYNTAFMDAGRISGANPYFLATRSKHEVGKNGSPAVSGTYGKYSGYYNFYNIGAFDGRDAVAKGLIWAAGGTSHSTTYGRPWTNPYKAIVGGAQFIAKNYINQGQNTLYFQKFNVVSKDKSKLYTHQYMTNVQAPLFEGRITRNGYNAMGILDDSMVFYIPIYNNMPASPCALPKVEGNPNPYLSDIAVYIGDQKQTITSTFEKPDSNGQLSNVTYSVVVPSNCTQVTIGAKTISKYASVNGTGTVSLGNPGETKTFNIVGKAQSGKEQVYTVKITRSSN